MTPQCLLLVTFLIFLVGGAIGASPHQSPDTKIIHGSYIDIRNVPYQVYVSGYDCGGVIVNDRWVLTAGHCTFGLRTNQIKIRAGSSNSQSGGVVYDAEDVKLHPGYKDKIYHNDISAIRTSRPISFGGSVGAVKLPAQSKVPPPLNARLRVTGWGRTETGQLSAKLKAANVVVTNFQRCRDAHYNVTPDDSVQFCVDPVNGIDCGGDSGGPVTKDNVLLGLVSVGLGYINMNGCPDKGPSLFVKVSFFRDWIRKITGT